jgi:peptide/nickel transport system permease protein
MALATTVASSPEQPAGFFSQAWRMLRGNPKVSIGLGILLFFILFAIFGPLLTPYDPIAFGPDLIEAPSATHWLGTTQTGQDVYAQVAYGARVSITMGFVVGAITTMISVIIGLISGYFGGLIDEILSLFSNVFLVLPALPLAIILAAYLPYKGPLTIGFVVTVTGWSWGARVLRSQALTMRAREFVAAARVTGESRFRIVFFEILPNMSAIVAAELLGTVIYAILAETGLEYLGLGDLNNVSWGTMFFFSANYDALLLGAWWWFVAPGLCIALLGAGLAFINFGIDEIANPRLRAVSSHGAKKKATRGKPKEQA